MTSSKNIIRKQNLHFIYNGHTDGIALQKEVNDWCNYNLNPEIEYLLDEFNQGGYYLAIDKLEIEAEVDSKNWKQELEKVLMINLKQKIEKYKTSSSGDALIKEDKWSKLDTLIIFYLKSGFLPWWGNSFLETDFKTVFNNWITEEKTTKRIDFLRNELELIISKNVAERIVIQVPGNQLFHFLKHIYYEYSEKITRFEVFLENVVLHQILNEKLYRIIKRIHVLVIYSFLKSRGNIEYELILHSIYRELIELHVSPEWFKPDINAINTGIEPLVQIWHKMIINEKRDAVTKHVSKGPANSFKTEDRISRESLVNPIDMQDKLKHGAESLPDLSLDKLLFTEPIDESWKKTELTEEIYIDNAGAVIFAAFIPALFERLGVAKNNIIINPGLAVLIIQYCVTGHTQIEEYQVVLPKILCGLEIDYPLDVDNVIEEYQMAEANLMLQSLIDYWSVLKDTSVEGLQEAFFIRNGKLKIENNEWKLNVEQKSYDMLLDKIPWSLSIIKLPWMKMLLKTEWI